MAIGQSGAHGQNALPPVREVCNRETAAVAIRHLVEEVQTAPAQTRRSRSAMWILAQVSRHDFDLFSPVELFGQIKRCCAILSLQ